MKETKTEKKIEDIKLIYLKGILKAERKWFKERISSSKVVVGQYDYSE